MSTIKTVIKTDLCSFSEQKIYPGHGKRFAAKDGKVWCFSGRKVERFAKAKVKPVALTWTQAWRRRNKKVRFEHGHKKRVRKAVKVHRPIIGLTLEDFAKKKTERKKQTPQDMAVAEAKALSKKAKQSGAQRQNIGKHMANAPKAAAVAKKGR